MLLFNDTTIAAYTVTQRIIRVVGVGHDDATLLAQNKTCKNSFQ